MNCDRAREQLAEHVLGILPARTDADVRRHLRGCAGCRAEMAALHEGVSTWSLAAHDAEPPETVRRRVAAVLEEEWSASPARRWSPRHTRRLAWVAVALVLGASLSWGVTERLTAQRHQAAAADWQRFLAALGGDDVRVGTFRATGAQPVEGSVVLYDSHEGRSWALVLLRAPGRHGKADVALSDGTRTIAMPDVEFDLEGEAQTWLVTGSNLTGFDTVIVTDRRGAVVATARVSTD